MEKHSRVVKFNLADGNRRLSVCKVAVRLSAQVQCLLWLWLQVLLLSFLCAVLTTDLISLVYGELLNYISG